MASNDSREALETVKFTCLECQFKTKDEGRMDIHVKEIHGNSTETVIDFICGECNHGFKVKEDYNAHMKTHEKTATEEEVEAIMIKKDKKEDPLKPGCLSKTFQCEKCNLEFEDTDKE